MREPFLNVLVHVTNICGTVLTLNRGDALTTQAQQHLHHLDSGKFWWSWTSSGFVHLWPRFIVTSWLQQHVKSHHRWMWWRNELCSHTMYFSILIALNPSRCTTFCTASVNTSGTRGIITCPHPPWTSDGKMRLATHSLVAMNIDWSTFCMSVDLTGSKVRMRNFSSRLRPVLLGLTWSLSSCAWVATRPCPIATCFLKFKKFLALGFRTFKFCRSFVFSYLITSSALGSSCTMTKRDSSFAGITYPSSSMSMPRRLSWRSRGHGQSSSTAAPSDSLHPSRSDTAPQAGPSISPTGSGEYTPHYGYSSANLATPIPSPADHQAPILPNPTRETYPLQHEMEEVRRQLHAYYFVEVQSPSDDNTQPALRRLMVTEVDRRGNHHNRQPEYFFNGIIGHIRAGQNGWIDSWDQSSQLANYWRRYFQIPEISPYGNWHPHQDEAPGSPDSVHESGMDDTDSIIANVDINPPPVQIHQLATFLWNILNNDREANMAILERLEDTEGDLSRHPVQIFSAADLAHLASHLAESTRTLSNQARRMEALPDEGLWALGLIHLMILPCILKPFPLQGSDNSIHRLRIWAKASRQRGVCVDHLHRCKTSFDCSEFSTLCLQGGSARLTDTAQRRHCQFVVIQSLISSAYLHQFFISLNGNRLSQVPACRLVSNFYYGLCYIWTFLKTSV